MTDKELAEIEARLDTVTLLRKDVVRLLAEVRLLGQENERLRSLQDPNSPEAILSALEVRMREQVVRELGAAASPPVTTEPGNLRANLLRLRNAASLSQYELAARARIGRAVIARIESGSQEDVQLSTLQALAGALRCRIADLV